MPAGLSCACVIVGAGPAGMMAAHLLARAGVDVVVLEKHRDFLRDFRGDTIHPSTMDVIAELGLLDAFLGLPHQAVKYAEGGACPACCSSATPPTRCRPSPASASTLTIQDAVAAANILFAPLRAGGARLADLKRVQRRREFPTRATQYLQVLIQNKVIDPILETQVTPDVPALVRLMQRWPWMQRIPARLIGTGFRPEHVQTPRQPG